MKIKALELKEKDQIVIDGMEMIVVEPPALAWGCGDSGPLFQLRFAHEEDRARMTVSEFCPEGDQIVEWTIFSEEGEDLTVDEVEFETWGEK